MPEHGGRRRSRSGSREARPTTSSARRRASSGRRARRRQAPRSRHAPAPTPGSSSAASTRHECASASTRSAPHQQLHLLLRTERRPLPTQLDRESTASIAARRTTPYMPVVRPDRGPAAGRGRLRCTTARGPAEPRVARATRVRPARRRQSRSGTGAWPSSSAGAHPDSVARRRREPAHPSPLRDPGSAHATDRRPSSTIARRRSRLPRGPPSGRESRCRRRSPPGPAPRPAQPEPSRQPANNSARSRVQTTTERRTLAIDLASR